MNVLVAESKYIRSRVDFSGSLSKLYILCVSGVQALFNNTLVEDGQGQTVSVT